jgi:hypothetical protein
MANDGIRSWPIDPTRPVINVADARLQRLMVTDAQRCASVNEYAASTGIAVARVIELLGEHLDAGMLSLEIAGGEVFVHTAPTGRRADGVQVPPNLWEMLRRSGNPEHAFRLWRMIRELEEAGWQTEADPKRIPETSIGEVALVGIRLGAYVMPLVVLPSADELGHPAGVLSRFERRSVPLVGVVCARGDADTAVTAVRRWMLTRHAMTRLDILILEHPRYQPVLLRGEDASVAPVSVTREAVEQLVLDADRVDGIDPSTPPR